MEISMKIPKNNQVKIESLHDLEIAILGTYSEEIKPVYQRRICSLIFLEK